MKTPLEVYPNQPLSVSLPPRTPHFHSNFLFSTFLSFDALFIYGLLTSISSQIAFFFGSSRFGVISDGAPSNTFDFDNSPFSFFFFL